MKLSQKSQEFVQKILKYYPLQQKECNQAKSKAPSQHMHDYRKERQIYQKPTQQKLENMRFFKEEGNNHYKNNRYQDAAYFYQKTIIYSDYTFPENQKDQSTMDQLVAQSHCNLALCLIKLGEWSKVKMHLLQASKSKIYKIKGKGLYWLAKYYIKSSEFQAAGNTLKQIKDMGQSYNKQVSQLSELLKQSLTKENGQEKKLCEGMFKK